MKTMTGELRALTGGGAILIIAVFPTRVLLSGIYSTAIVDVAADLDA
jgi:hypothetical protein